jgi:Ca2+-binding RTX toxin-like protein
MNELEIIVSATIVSPGEEVPPANEFEIIAPDGVQTEGVEANGISRDYGFKAKPASITIYNDNRADGDSILLLELPSNTSGRGFAQDLYVFQENKIGVTEFPRNESPFGYNSYDAPITSSPNQTIQFAVVLIQDNEEEEDGNLRRTSLGAGNDVKEFLSDNIKDTILAGAGNDVIRSGGGDDIVFGQEGDDQIYGGAGDDYLFGNQGNDLLFGGEGNDWLDGGLGNDRMEGGNGNDTYVIDSFGDQIIDSPGTGIEIVRSSINFTLQDGLDYLILTGNAEKGTGNRLDNVIRGNDFNNILDGGDGNDILFGDRLISAEVANRAGGGRFISYEDFQRNLNNPNIREGINKFLQDYESDQSLGGNDILRGGAGNDRLFGWGGDDILEGGAGNNYLYGGFGNDKLFGGANADLLDGGAGADRLEGGGGDDIYVIDNLNDIIIDRPQTGIETVESSITFDLRQYSMAIGSPIVGVTGLDNITLTGSSDIDAFGNNLPNVLLGNSRDNKLDGREGDDTMIASNGFDELTGGLGADKFRFNELTFGKTTIQDFKPGEDIIEISNSGFSYSGRSPALSDFGFDSLSGNLSFRGDTFATIKSSSPFSINQNMRLI